MAFIPKRRHWQWYSRGWAWMQPRIVQFLESNCAYILQPLYEVEKCARDLNVVDADEANQSGHLQMYFWGRTAIAI